MAHAPRGAASRRGAAAAGFGDWEPALKRSRSSGAASHAPALPGFAAGAGSFWPASAGQPATAEPVQHFLQALAGTTPPPLPLPALPVLPEAALPPMPAPAPARPPSPPAYEDAEKLHALADLALAHEEELLAAEAAAQEAAAQLDGLGDRLGSVASASGSGQQPAGSAGLQQLGASGLSSKAAALVEQQQQLAAEVRQHLAQQAVLLERLGALRRAADDLLGRPELAAAAQPSAVTAEAGEAPPAPLPEVQAPAPAVAAAALRLAAEHAAAGAAVPAAALSAAPAAAAAAVPAVGMAPQVASLIASIAAAAATGPAAGAVTPPAGVSMEEFLPLVQQQIQLQLQQRLFRLAA